MANISDLIEAFLLESLEMGASLNISRIELSRMFDVAPSQINYVLTTRFTPDRGFAVESKRGGGGFITLFRLSETPYNILNEMKGISISEGVSYRKAVQILERLSEEEIITPGGEEVLKAVLADSALIAPLMTKDNIRAGMLKGLAMHLLKEDGNNEHM